MQNKKQINPYNTNRINIARRSRTKFALIIFAISLLLGLLIISNFRENLIFFYSPSDLENPNIITKINNNFRSIKIGGMVVENSIKQISPQKFIFKISDFKSEIAVEYSGILPDLFREKQGAVMIGKYNSSSKIFISNEILIKHDEKYMPPEIKNLTK